MTNEQKYETPGERIKAFDEWCHAHPNCNKCELADKADNTTDCPIYWLPLEAEEELDPCPFCGGKTILKNLIGGFCVRCGCGYTSPFAETEAAAIAAHNRVARAVRSAKESEARK